MWEFALAAALTTTKQPVASTPFDLTQLLQFGLLGLIFIFIVLRKFIVPEWTLKSAEERANAEKDDLAKRLTETREQLDRLQDVFQDQMIPALTRATEINARYTDELQKARYVRKNPRATTDSDSDE
jgi:hypothetical protein